MKLRFSILLFSCLALLPSAHADFSSSAVPNSVVQALASGDVLLALEAFHETPTNAKSRYLFHEILHAIKDDVHQKNKTGKDSKFKLEQQIRRRGLAYHNLYLFLRTQDINEKSFLKKARGYYTHAARMGSELDHAKCQVLLATIFTFEDEHKRAEKQFAAVNSQLLAADAEMVSYVADYWAAREDLEQTLVALEYAHSLAPKQISASVEEGDDFFLVKSDPRFQELLKSWQQHRKTTPQHELNIPHSNTLTFDLPELGSQYRFSVATRAQKKTKLYKKLYPNF